jgi:TldD protein
VPSEIDPMFLALPLRELADAALGRACAAGAAHADFRCEWIKDAQLSLRDCALDGAHSSIASALGVRVVLDGAWGFASCTELTTDGAAQTAARAMEMAKITRPLCSERVELAAEPVHSNVTWISSYEMNPFDVPDSDKLALLDDWSRGIMAGKGVNHVYAKLQAVQENKFYADLAGTVTTQERVRIHPQFIAISIDAANGSFETMRTLAPPVSQGWEYLTRAEWDWDAELACLPELLAEKMRAPSVEAGTYDLVIDPSNLWLTIHESIGHATELDRVLGYEAAYAGTSFATFDKFGILKYGSPVVNVTADRIAEHGLATIGYDDEGVAAQCWDIIRDGVLFGCQLDRRTARLRGFARSNGCASGDSASCMAIQRMANISLKPAIGGPSTENLIAATKRGIYVVGDKSWSIDMQRYNFQFTGQRFYKIENGRLAGQLRDVAYQSTTTDFWGSAEAVGGPATYVLYGADRCGKSQPLQLAAVSHGSPSVLFRNIRVLNMSQEAER